MEDISLAFVKKNRTKGSVDVNFGYDREILLQPHFPQLLGAGRLHDAQLLAFHWIAFHVEIQFCWL